MITTRQRHQRLAWRGRVLRASLRSQRAISDREPAPDPKQPFSRQNYVGTLGGPIVREKLWFFSAFEMVHEHASIAYSPASQTEFDALVSTRAMG